MLKKSRIYLVCRLGKKLNGILATEGSPAICISTYLITGIYQNRERKETRILLASCSTSFFPEMPLFDSRAYNMFHNCTWPPASCPSHPFCRSSLEISLPDYVTLWHSSLQSCALTDHGRCTLSVGVVALFSRTL